MAGMNVMQFEDHNQQKTNILFPTSMTRSYQNVEQSFQTEDGYTQAIVTRRDKETVTMQFTCSSEWTRKFKTFYMMDTFFFIEYDSILGTKTREVRMTAYSEDFIKNSYVVDSTVSQGLWNVSFTLEEL